MRNSILNVKSRKSGTFFLDCSSLLKNCKNISVNKPSQKLRLIILSDDTYSELQDISPHLCHIAAGGLCLSWLQF